jgi:hypothetical protein
MGIWGEICCASLKQRYHNFTAASHRCLAHPESLGVTKNGIIRNTETRPVWLHMHATACSHPLEAHACGYACMLQPAPALVITHILRASSASQSPLLKKPVHQRARKAALGMA